MCARVRCRYATKIEKSNLFVVHFGKFEHLILAYLRCVGNLFLSWPSLCVQIRNSHMRTKIFIQQLSSTNDFLIIEEANDRVVQLKRVIRSIWCKRFFENHVYHSWTPFTYRIESKFEHSKYAQQNRQNTELIRMLLLVAW